MGFCVYRSYVRGRLEDNTVEENRRRKYGYRVQEIRQRNSYVGQGNAILGYICGFRGYSKEHPNIFKSCGRTTESGHKGEALEPTDEVYKGSIA